VIVGGTTLIAKPRSYGVKRSMMDARGAGIRTIAAGAGAACGASCFLIAVTLM
jgi:hypothetical protein